MNPHKQIEQLQQALTVQAIALELMNAVLVRVDGDAHTDRWCQAIDLAYTRFQEMTIAERNAYSQKRKDLFLKWIEDHPRNSPSTDKGAA